MSHHAAAASHGGLNGNGNSGRVGGHPGHPHNNPLAPPHPYGAIDPSGLVASAYSRHSSCQSAAAAQMHAHMQNGQFGNGGANSTGKFSSFFTD